MSTATCMFMVMFMVMATSTTIMMFMVVMMVVTTFTFFLMFVCVLVLAFACVVMVVMIASGIGIIRERPFRKGFCSGIRRTGHAAVELDPGFGQGGLRSHADPAADQGIGLRGFQETGQRAVTAAVGGNDLFRYNFAVLHIVEL